MVTAHSWIKTQQKAKLVPEVSRDQLNSQVNEVNSLATAINEMSATAQKKWQVQRFKQQRQQAKYKVIVSMA
ncbi:hypothetical protein O9992_21445 [Vibrio lentus]|nr:hypothetical protein [Vibrio lentus]